MKNHNQYFFLIRTIYFAVLILLFTSCTKESSINTKAGSLRVRSFEDDIYAVKQIVGNDGHIFLMSKEDTASSKVASSVDASEKNIKPLSIEAFEKIYKSLKQDSLYAVGVPVTMTPTDSLVIKSSSIKANDEWAEDGPGPAGLYRFTFWPGSGNNPSFFSNLNLSFNTNADGSINGIPSLYFSGVQLFGWQSQQTSLISFNPSTFVSTFAIMGVATFGIQLGSGTTIGWGSNMTFYVTINMDENTGKPVMIYAQN